MRLDRFVRTIHEHRLEHMFTADAVVSVVMKGSKQQREELWQ